MALKASDYSRRERKAAGARARRAADREAEGFMDKVTALPGGKVAVEIVCRECGKPLTVVNEHGMFCEDMCGFEESKRAAKIVKKMVESLGKMFEERQG